MHKAPPPMPDTSRLRDGCFSLTLALLVVPSALVVLIFNLF